MGYHTSHHVTDEERREFLETLGVVGTVAVTGTVVNEVTLDDLQEAVSVESEAELTEIGQAIRADLDGQLDAALIESAMADLVTDVSNVPNLLEGGIPAAGEAVYGDLTTAAWRIEDHLKNVGFFETAETHLPPFTPSHIESTTRQIIEGATLSDLLTEIGFDAHEQRDLLVDVVTNNEVLSLWAPSYLYEEQDVEDVMPEHVPPLHERAAGGVLLWLDGLDEHLWQNEVLITQEMLERGLWDVKAMLGGFYLLSAAANGIANEAISDASLTALISGSTAIMILMQTNLKQNLVYITDKMKAREMGGA